MCKNILFFFSIIILIAGCKSTQELSSDSRGGSYGIEDLKYKDIPNPDAIDSKVGVLESDVVTFAYDYGKYSNPGPITPQEEFRRSFDTYHHRKFFEDRMIDPKVYKLFLDSVRVVEVRMKTKNDPLMFSCDPCNTTAVVTFKGDTYHYPITLSEKQLDMQGYDVEFKIKGDNIHKIYQEKGERPALYISPIRNRFKKKKTLSLTVIETTLSDSEIVQLLDKAYIKN